MSYQDYLDAADVTEVLPGINGHYRKTSEATIEYNCLAWAVGNNEKWFDVQRYCAGYYWPKDVEREWSVAAIKKIFSLYGFTEETLFQDYEEGFDKVAMYVSDEGVPTHFARQLPNGKWTSKLGELIDVEHDDLKCLEGSSGYGTMSVILKKKK